MKKLDWKVFVETGDFKYQEKLQETQFGWTDIVTGTEFYLDYEEYKKCVDDIKQKLSNNYVGSINEYFRNNPKNSLPYYDLKSNPKITLWDAARLFVLFSYLLNGKDSEDRLKLREDSYRSFFRNERTKFQNVWNILDSVNCDTQIPLQQSLNIKILKGGPYKIKKYYLENNELKDIRGASILLGYVTEEHIPDIIGKRFIDECIIYSGGGNILAVLPEWAEEKLPIELEMEVHKYTIGAQNAFSLSDCISLEKLFFKYKDTIQDIENQLNERKKLKLYNTTKSKSAFEKEKCFDISVDKKEKVDFSGVTFDGTGKCKLCGSREASYKVEYSYEVINVCGSCIHKHLTGRMMKKGILKLYEEYTNTNIEYPENIADIKDEKGYVAVIYADGNNMGSIVKDIDSLGKMMYFSRRTSETAQKALFDAIKSFYNGKFEIVAVGGDDIFVIVPGNKSIEFTTKMIENFNNSFQNLSSDANEYKATLSAGICIGKYKTPIRIMLEHAEEKMNRSKKYERIGKLGKGSLDFVVVNDVGQVSGQADCDSCNKNDIEQTLLPYTPEMAIYMTGLVKELKRNRVKTNLNNMLYAFDKAESKLEAQLFYDYNQVRNKKNISNCIKNPPKKIFESGLYKSLDNNKLYSPWGDILDMWDFCGGDN